VGFVAPAGDSASGSSQQDDARAMPPASSLLPSTPLVGCRQPAVGVPFVSPQGVFHRWGVGLRLRDKTPKTLTPIRCPEVLRQSQPFATLTLRGRRGPRPPPQPGEEGSALLQEEPNRDTHGFAPLAGKRLTGKRKPAGTAYLPVNYDNLSEPLPKRPRQGSPPARSAPSAADLAAHQITFQTAGHDAATLLRRLPLSQGFRSNTLFSHVFQDPPGSHVTSSAPPRLDGAPDA
jgi:hypothetical protein